MTPTKCRRQIPGATIARRAEDSTVRTLAGYAAVFDEWTTLYKGRSFEFREVIRPGAFRNAIAENQDVRALFNHASDNVLGRTLAGTLRLREDGKGLAVEIDPPDDEFSRRVVGLIGRGDVSQMSFAFLPRDGGEKLTIRTVNGVDLYETEVTDVDLFDVAPVTFPAYTNTSIGLRSLTPVASLQMRRMKQTWLAEARAKSDELARRLCRA